MKLGICCLMLLAVTTARADYYSGNLLKEAMDYGDEQSAIALVRGYVAGVQDVWNGVHFCAPPKVKLAQAEAIVRKYFDEHPEEWHEPAKKLVRDAMIEAYPCGD